MDPQTLIASDMLTVTLLVTLLIGVVKPLVEALPFARPSQPAHDAALRTLGVVLNLALLCGMLASQGHWDWHNWYLYLAAALGQQVGSHVTFKVVSGPAAVASGDPSAAAVASVTVAAQAAAADALAGQAGA